VCTNIVEKAEIAGSGKGPNGWFALKEVAVSFDHPLHYNREHALNIDFVNDAEGLGARVAVELSPQAAMELIRVIQTALDKGKKETGETF